jgi:hypothetical protein
MRRSLFLLIALLALLAPPVFAQEGLPPWATVDNNGQITFNPNGLTPTGAIMVPPPPGYASVQIDVGNGQTFCLGCLTFNTYAASDGSAVIIPTNYAAVVMADAHYNPFNQPVESYMGNTLLSWFAQSGNFDPVVSAPEAQHDAQVIRDMLTSGQLDPLFLARMNAEMNNPNSPLFQNDLFLGAGLFTFRCHPVTGTCRNGTLGDNNGTPPPSNGTPGPQPTPEPTDTPDDEDCPLNLRVSQQPPTLDAGKLGPEHPVVVGQDPTKRGVDVSANIVIHPVIVKYDVAKYEHECQYVGGTVTDSACQNNPGYKNKKIFAGCETKTETYIDKIAFTTIEANLSPASISWITNELAAKYPGAHVYQAHWSLWPGRTPTQGGMSADGASLNVMYGKLPLADPGTYSVLIQGTTTGTPYTAPRPFAYTYPDLAVYLMESTIIK